MLGLLERSIASIERRLILLAPPEAVTTLFSRVTRDAVRRDRLLHDMQRLRGAAYLEDGAIRREDLAPDGRHRTPEDKTSWHLLMTNAEQEITACVWYRDHHRAASIEQLRLRDCPLRQDASMGDLVTRAVEHDMAQARIESLRYVEVGGWAVSKQARGAVEGLILGGLECAREVLGGLR